jgi:hypothetical protein
MARYFNYFPTTPYITGGQTASVESVTNIIARFSFENKLKENENAFYKYTIKDSDTPEIIAHKYYGHSERHWIVLNFNDIIDPQYDWPLQYDQFISFVSDKYAARGAANTTVQTGLEWSQDVNNTQAYYKVVTRTNPADGTAIEEKIEIDADTYANVGASTVVYTLSDGSKTSQAITKLKTTYYDYEDGLNEGKREINLLQSQFVTALDKEFKRVIAG